jgi:hypothetical protein
LLSAIIKEELVVGLFDLFKKKVNSFVDEDKKGRKNVDSKNSDVYTVKSEIVYSNYEAEVIPVETKIKGMKPNVDGLYPHEILLLSYAPKYYVGYDPFPGFWWYQYGIKNVSKYLESLLNRGFLKLGSLRSTIENETMAVLKAVLKENTLKQTGKKSDLVDRLLESFSADKLNSLFTKVTYEPTELGVDVLKREAHIPYIHHNSIYGLDIWKLDEKVNERKPRIHYRDVIWGFLNEKSLLHIKNGNVGSYKNTLYTMSRFVLEEGRIDTSFSLMCDVIKHDLSGMSDNFNLDYLFIVAPGYFPYEKSSLKLAPYIVGPIADYKEKKSLTEEQLRVKMLENMERSQLPFSVFTIEECVDIVLFELVKDEVSLDKIFKQAEKRLHKKYGKYLKDPY